VTLATLDTPGARLDPSADLDFLPKLPSTLAKTDWPTSWPQHISAVDNIASASASTWIIIGAAIIVGLKLWRRGRKKLVIFLTAAAVLSGWQAGNEEFVCAYGFGLIALWLIRQFQRGVEPRYVIVTPKQQPTAIMPGTFPWERA
jgi:hypothetical protein